MEAKRCCERVYSGFGRSPCANKAKVERDGKRYCAVHDPVRAKARDDARVAARNVRWERDKEKWAAEEALKAEMQRRYDCHDALVEALKHARNEIASFPRSLGYAITALPRIDAALGLAGETP